MKKSAGILLYRQGSQGLEVLLVHPSGKYNRKSPWGIPKGEPDPEETDLEATARRETLEETGVAVTGPLLDLGTIQYQKSRKIVYAFASPASQEMEPRLASWEIDQARFMSLEEARQRLHPEQQPFLDHLVKKLAAAEK